MIFDLFHSISDPEIHGKTIGQSQSIQNFIRQVELAESLGMDTCWLAESHFSSEVQKRTPEATIQNFYGEVGLNSDSFQWIHFLVNRTKRIGFGTGIHNIVGGSGGPIASADRVNTLRFINHNYWGRNLKIGVASGRFPYQNVPFGILPRNSIEEEFWPLIKPYIFLEALEIFLRLLNGEELRSDIIGENFVNEKEVEKLHRDVKRIRSQYRFPLKINKWWEFSSLKLVPYPAQDPLFRFVIGSSDPRALELAFRYTEPDLFNLSFTPPEQIETLHDELSDFCEKRKVPWHRSRLPRTVLVFPDPERKKAYERANQVLDGYIDAMHGTAAVPDKHILLERALVGDAEEIIDQLSEGNPRGFHANDRLMLWFEFFQEDAEGIENRMKYFYESVVARLT